MKSYSLEQLHKTMGHCNVQDLLKLENVTKGVKVMDSNESFDCETCLQCKQTRNVISKSRVRATQPLQVVYTDINGPVTPLGKGGYNYVIVFIDDFSGMKFHYCLKNKSDSYKALLRFLCDTNEIGKTKCIYSGNYISQEFKYILLKHNIRNGCTAKHRVAERNWRTMFKVARCMVHDAMLPRNMLPYANCYK